MIIWRLFLTIFLFSIFLACTAQPPKSNEPISFDSNKFMDYRKKTGSVGMVVLKVEDVYVLLDRWSMMIDLTEGLDSPDTAEVSLIATNDKKEKLTFTIPFKNVSPDNFNIEREYSIGTQSELNFQTGKHNFDISGGKINISNHQSGKIKGSFSIETVLDNKPSKIIGQFEGAAGIACNALLKADNSEGIFARNSNSTASWLLVDINHPFCKQYL